MEAAGLALSAAQTLLAALGCQQLQHIFSIWGYQSELQSLQRTVSCVQAVLLDAQSRDHLKLTNFERDTIQKLKDALYDADDLLDEFATLARQHQISDDKFLGKVRGLFPCFKKLKIVYRMSKEVNSVRKKLDQTTKEAAMFGFKVKFDPQHNRVFSRDETHSYANENSIVGRDEDKRRIVDMLLDSNILEDVFVLTIVGVGGLGKTTLAQLVYNDQRIQAEFHSRIWVCVSDQDQNKPDKGKMILAKILKSASVETCTDNFTYDSVVQKLRKVLSEEKCILVLDDVWTEDPVQYQEWLDVLKGCAQRGSRIVVTTRSKGTATAVSSNRVYELQGLSDEYSWSLFEMVVGKEQANHPDLIEMGRDIVKKCANVPLAIKVLGSLLRGQDKNKWRSFHQSKLNEIRKDESGNNNIIKILKFSYYHLPPALKTCFAYCAVFPKDSKIRMDKLLRLWLAQGYVKPLDGGQVVEEAAEEYFRILVQRCFFQNLEWDDDAEEIRFKIHDLMHDIAQEVAGHEVFVGGSSDPSCVDKRVHHFFDDQPGTRREDSFATRTAVRSYVHESAVFSFPRSGIFSFPGSGSQFPVSSLLANWKCLRALDLSNIWTDDLPDEIGELLHLRYIDLSCNCNLKMLPESFTKLINLEILILDGCSKLKELPKGFNKLVNLRTLSVCGGENPNGYGWHGLSYMPLGMEKLTTLCHLNGFVVGKRESNLHDVGGLRELKGLTNLRGCLEIWIPWGYKHVKEDDGDGYLSNKKHLSDIYIQFCNEGGGETSEGDGNSDEAVLEDLMPHPNLEMLAIQGYKGVKIPSWASQDNLAIFLPNLVKIFFNCIAELQELPYLSKLPFLKALEVSAMENLMYMENRTQEYSSSLFFPSLEELSLRRLPNLEGWWKTAHLVPSFPRLSSLCIKGCPKLVSFPLCPTIEKLLLQNFDERLQIMTQEEIDPSHGPKLRYLETDCINYIRSLPAKALQSLEKIRVDRDANVENLSEVEEALYNCSTSLQSLEIFRCFNLKSVSGGLKHLTALNSLVLLELPKLSLKENALDDDILHRRSFLPSLKSLTIDAGNLEAMLERIGCCSSSLQSLYVTDCDNLESLPEGMRKLASLRFLVLEDCSESLKRRCRGPDGEDWPKNQHIRQVQIREEDKYDRYLAFILDLPPRAHLSKSMGYRKTKLESLHGYGMS